MNFDFLSSTLSAGVDYLQQLLATAMGTDNEKKDEKKTDELEEEEERKDEKEMTEPQPQEDALIASQNEPQINGQILDEKVEVVPVVIASNQEPITASAAESNSDHFDADRMADLFRSCLDKDLKTVNASDFISACKQVPKLMAGMGNTMKLGNSKLYEKINWLERRLNEAAEDLGQPNTKISLQDMIERDIEHKWTHTGKPTNHATRNIVRLVWFLDFITALFRAVAADSGKGQLKKILMDVYKESLGTHHPYGIRKLTETGIRVGPIPSRATFANHIGFGDLTIKEQNTKLLEWAEVTDEVAVVMWQFIDSKNLRDVP